MLPCHFMFFCLQKCEPPAFGGAGGGRGGGQHHLYGLFALEEPALRIEVVEQQRQLHEGKGSSGPTGGPLLQQLTLKVFIKVPGCHQP
jgi:hypothetical protein